MLDMITENLIIKKEATNEKLPTFQQRMQHYPSSHHLVFVSL